MRGRFIFTILAFSVRCKISTHDSAFIGCGECPTDKRLWCQPQFAFVRRRQTARSRETLFQFEASKLRACVFDLFIPQPLSVQKHTLVLLTHTHSQLYTSHYNNCSPLSHLSANCACAPSNVTSCYLCSFDIAFECGMTFCSWECSVLSVLHVLGRNWNLFRHGDTLLD